MRIPVLVNMTPPAILGAAYLTTRAFQGEPIEQLAKAVAQHANEASRLLDQSLIERLAFRPVQADILQAKALQLCRLFRIDGRPDARRRVLAIMLPGDLMANTPLDFILQNSDIRLDLLYYLPGHPLPTTIPDHDIAIFAAGDATPQICAELQKLFDAWPRPAINAPRCVPGLERDALSASLAGIPSIYSPPARRFTRQAVLSGFHQRLGPQLVRPAGSHGGHGLVRIESDAALSEYLATVKAEHYYLTPFVDYRSADGLFRKYRVAFVERQPFLCHMAISDHWMIHYLNAGMTQSAAKRAEEAQAMAQFQHTFARRHAAAFAALNDVIGLEYYSIDCAETPDGRLLVFEADNAAIIHMMDPPELFAYKRPHMQAVFAAFAEMLTRHSFRRDRPIENQSCSRLADASA